MGLFGDSPTPEEIQPKTISAEQEISNHPAVKEARQRKATDASLREYMATEIAGHILSDYGIDDIAELAVQVADQLIVELAKEPPSYTEE